MDHMCWEKLGGLPKNRPKSDDFGWNPSTMDQAQNFLLGFLFQGPKVVSQSLG